jgi:hypothetical protein
MSTRTRAVLHLTLSGWLLAGAVAAHAANLGFLSDTPIAYMSTRDIDSVKAAVIGALNRNQDGQAASWDNHGTGNGTRIDATITPRGSAAEGARTCRDVTVVLNAKGQSMTLRPQFCRVGSGPWQLQKRH